MEHQPTDYILCADETSLNQAIAAVKSCTAVILDCEGENLGQEGGSLSLICLRAITPITSPTYLIDTISLTSNALRPLFDSLQSSTLTKIVFDGRMDFSELYHGHGVTMRGALDLQLADIISRRRRGEDRDDQLRRLSPYINARDISGQPNCYFSVQKLCSLDQCLKEHDVVIQGKGSVNHDVWLKRPIPEQNLEYASRDIHLISLLHEDFKQKDYLGDHSLLEQSTRYISLWKDAKPRKMDEYRSHALLPLQVIDYDWGSPTLICMGCQRSFPEKGYSKSGWRLAAKRYCWVCHAIKTRKHMHYYVWERDSDDDDGYGWNTNDDSDGYGWNNDSDEYGWDMSDDGYSSF